MMELVDNSLRITDLISRSMNTMVHISTTRYPGIPNTGIDWNPQLPSHFIVMIVTQIGIQVSSSIYSLYLR